MVIAHRGDPHNHRENTLPALRAALDAGADALAIDVGLTRDGHVVVLHHDALRRVWGQARELADASFTDLAMLSRGGLRIPTLLEVLSEFARPGSPPLILNVPTVETALAADLAVREYSRTDRTILLGPHEPLRALRARQTPTSLALTWQEQGLPPPELWETLRPAWFSAFHATLAPDLVAELRRRGHGVLAWLVSDHNDMARLLQMNVDGILTDRPGELAPLARRYSSPAVG
ncbi:glycerophosphodiester phosphodiesterase [Spiractinospora alimapuensis]|uniref:glycerophosphodiester phosphodiesterase n=1 Tax=Spiractinospora alimapuensis TaxID=2820884 RepID=UPI001F355B78|nr:glycerophosphodiester phosphodiesterase [Spiractinospora alimapuensis]